MLRTIEERSNEVQYGSPQVYPSHELQILKVLPTFKDLEDDLVENGDWAWYQSELGPTTVRGTNR